MVPRWVRGFTLAELLVVVIIIMLLIGAVLGSTGSFAASEYQAKSTAREVAGAMERARQRSAVTGGLVRLVYDFDRQILFLKEPRKLEEGEYAADYEGENIEELLSNFSSVEFGDADDVQASRIWLESVQTYDGKTHDSGEFFIDILPTGSSIGHVVHIRNLRPLSDDEEFMSVELNPITGLASVYETFKEVAEPVEDFS